MFLSGLFGHSSSTAVSSHPYSTEQYHGTVIYDRNNDYDDDYFNEQVCSNDDSYDSADTDGFDDSDAYNSGSDFDNNYDD